MPKPVTYTLEALCESLGSISGPESSEEARRIFPPIPEDIADPMKHAFDAANRVFEHSPMSRDAKRELVKLSKFVFNLQLALVGKSCEEVASRAYVLGLLIGRLQARERELPFELLVDREHRLVFRHGRICKVTKRQHDILLCVKSLAESSLRQVVKSAWGAPYQSCNRGRYDKEISRLNKTLHDHGIGLSLHVRGERLVCDKIPPV
jgi:hypothetical protein